MASVEALQAEHRLIRHTLSAFQEVLANSQPSEVAQDIHQAVVELLEAHIRKEEQVMAPYGSQIQAVRRADALRDHVEPTVVLRDLGVLFSAWQHVPTGLLAIHLTHLIDELRECFDEEERRVFPIVEHAEEDAKRIWRPQAFVEVEERGREPCKSVSS
jgi:hemerythrin-like domain-containing protein